MELEKETTFIYGLIDPRISDEYRYIGKSHNPKRRLADGHLCDHNVTYKTNWIKSLAKQNLKPEVVIIAEVPRKEWPEWEQYYIRHFWFLGHNLTNSTYGGEGLSSLCTSGENNSFFGKKHTEKSKRKMSLAKKGKKASLVTRKKMSLRRGDKSPVAKLTEKKVKEIKTLIYQNYFSQTELANKFNITAATISDIKKEKTWKNIKLDTSKIKIDETRVKKRKEKEHRARALSKQGTKTTTAKLNEEKVKEILNLLKTKQESQTKIAAKYGVDASIISCINTGKYWKHVSRKVKGI